LPTYTHTLFLTWTDGRVSKGHYIAESMRETLVFAQSRRRPDENATDSEVSEPMSYPRLVGDVGGTNARFGWKSGPDSPLTDIAMYAAAAHPTLLDTIRLYLADHAKPAPRACAIGIANPVVGDRVQMTNHNWSFSISAVQGALGVERLLVINDFTALALSLVALTPADLRRVGGGTAVANAPVALIGPGTGLGVSGLLPALKGAGMTPINGEGGHVTLAGTCERDDAVIQVLRRCFGHASAERALSGPGLVNLYGAVCELDGVAAHTFAPADVTAHAVAGSNAQCAAAVDLFLGFLGTVAGNLAVTLGARGGLYIGGGIVPRLGGLIDRSSFRERFEDKGRFRAYLREIPTWVVQAGTSPALIGAARALDEL
jgi:glucokinase